MRFDIFNQLELACKYHELGLQLIPLPAGEKAARRKWKGAVMERPQTPADIDRMFGHQVVNTAIYSGPESGNFCTIDIDRPDLWSWCNYNIPHFTDIASRTLSCKSGGRGGVHIGIKTERPLTNTHFQHPAKPGIKGGDIIARGGYALYPRSEIRGGEYQLLFDGFGGVIDLDINDPALNELVRVFNLREYTEPEPLPARDNTSGIIYKNGKPYGLSNKIWNLLTVGDVTGRYPSRSELDQAVITSCVLRGWDLDTVKELYRRHSPADSKYKERKGHQRDKYLEYNYRKAERYLAQNKGQIDRGIDQLHGLVDIYPWKGQGGRVDRDLTRALLEIARRRRSLDGFGASVRELAELTGTGEGSTHRAIQRNPFIIDTETNGVTCTFKVKAPKDKPCEKSVPVLQFGDNTRADLFRWQGLGKAGADIYQALLKHGESDIMTLSQRAGVAFRTVYNKLTDLERCGLVTVKKQGRQTLLKAVPGADLVKAARIIGTAGTLRRQIERHDRERRAYKAYIDRIKN